MKNKAFWVTFSFYFLLFLADVFFTFRTGELAQHLEANPLFLITKSFVPIIILNFIILFLFYWTYQRNKTSHTMRFVIINQMVAIIGLRLVAIRNAIHWIKNPITVEQAVEVYTTAVKSSYILELAWIVYLPLIISFVSFFIWQFDHIIFRKDIIKK